MMMMMMMAIMITETTSQGGPPNVSSSSSQAGVNLRLHGGHVNARGAVGVVPATVTVGARHRTTAVLLAGHRHHQGGGTSKRRTTTTTDGIIDPGKTATTTLNHVEVVVVELGDLVQRRKDAVLRRTGEVGNAVEGAVVLADRLVQFDARPDAGGELCGS